MNTQPLAKRALTFVMAITIAFSGFAAPQRAHAIFGIEDISFDPAVWFQDLMSAFFTGEDNLKEYVLDPLAWAAAKAVIHSLSQSLINWINSGFQGSPSFETDLRRSMGQLQDTVAADFFRSLERNTGIDADAPFRENVTNYLKQSYYKSTNGSQGFLSTNLSKNNKKPSEFREGKIYNSGGWDSWFNMVMNEDNNTYGAVLKLQDKLNKDFENFRVTRLNELQWGRGFFSWKGDCMQYSVATSTALTNEDKYCAKYETKTPGTVIESQLEHQLGSNLRQLEIADEVDEIIGALMNQLVQKVLDEGLSSLSKPSSGGGKSYTDQLGESAGGAGGLADKFIQNMKNQLKTIQQFKKHWQSIFDMAKEAQASCASNNQNKMEDIQQTLDQSQTGVQRGEVAIESINNLLARAEIEAASSTNPAKTFGEINAAFEKLRQDGTIPSIQEIGEAEFEAGDMNTQEPKTLYSKMKKLRDDCRKK